MTKHSDHFVRKDSSERVARRCDDTVDKKRMNSCVRKHLCWRELSNQKKTPTKNRKHSLRRVTNVTFAKFRSWHRQKKKEFETALRAVLLWINSDILKSCLLHYLHYSGMQGVGILQACVQTLCMLRDCACALRLRVCVCYHLESSEWGLNHCIWGHSGATSDMGIHAGTRSVMDVTCRDIDVGKNSKVWELMSRFQNFAREGVYPWGNWLRAPKKESEKESESAHAHARASGAKHKKKGKWEGFGESHPAAWLVGHLFPSPRIEWYSLHGKNDCCWIITCSESTFLLCYIMLQCVVLHCVTAYCSV